MIATHKENIRGIKAKLAGLKRAQRFIPWNKSSELSHQLIVLLADIMAGVTEPKTGVEQITKFYECDNNTFGRCDDSSGVIGDVFRFEAQKLFIHYAAGCDDKSWLCEIILNLLRDDEYGIRAELLDSASSFLPTDSMRELIDRFWWLSKKEKSDSWKAHRWLSGIESLARQLGDAPLFEEARLKAWPKLTIAACMDIARVYLDTGDAPTALSWMEKAPKAEHFEYEKNQLLQAIYEKLGDQEKLADIAWRIFRNSRSKQNLEKLLQIIGEDKYEQVVNEQSRQILKDEYFSYTDAAFLIEIGRMDDAETYIILNADKLDGDFYWSLLPLAKNLEMEDHWLAACVIYRALLESILRRAISKYYHHGVRYLKKLDTLSPNVTNWREIPLHDIYKQELTKIHFRKKAFWTKYVGNT